MAFVDQLSMVLLGHDPDDRERILRSTVRERLAANPPPRMDDHIVATYFLALRTRTLAGAAEEISYHATVGIKDPPRGSLLEACSATRAGVDPFDASGRVGLLHVAFPLKMMLQPDGHLTSCDILHTVAGAVIFDMYENREARLVNLRVPESVVRTFPGPAYGPLGLRKLAGFADDQPAFGTILKPTAGITPDDVERLVTEVADSRLLMLIKEDEDLYPNLDYSPVGERTRRAVSAIERAREARGGLGLIYAPHISGAPNEILDTLHAALEAGAIGVMFSETYAGGTVRMVREATRYFDRPPAIYGHNAGIGARSNGAIFREVIDLLARLDGIDVRQTAPVRPGSPYIRPYGEEWLASEEALTKPLPGINPTMIARAGALDQGNLIPNLIDVEDRGLVPNVLFLAGSAINSIANEKGAPDPRLGIRAMLEALEVHQSGDLRAVPVEGHLDALIELARGRNLSALLESIRQRYPGRVD